MFFFRYIIILLDSRGGGGLILIDLKIVTYVKVIGRIIYLFMVVIYIRNENDIIILPLITFIVNFASLLFLYIDVSKKGYLCKRSISKSNIKLLIINNFQLFLSRLSISLYTASPPLVLVYFVGESSVGLYGAVDRIISAVKGIYSAISRAGYIYLTTIENKNIRLLKKPLKITIFVMFSYLIFNMILYYVADELFMFIFSDNSKLE